MQSFLITAAAGLISALLYNALFYAGGFGLVLIYLAPFPVILVGLALRWVMGFGAALVGAIAMAALFGVEGGLAYFFAVGLPAGILGYLALLARENGTGALEWFPVGELIVAAAALSVFIVTGGAMLQGGFTALDAAAGTMFDNMVAQAGSPLAAEGVNVAELRQLFLLMLPLAGAVSLFLSYLASLYIAGRILRARGVLLRPWPDIAALKLPFWAALFLLTGIVLSMLDGAPGRIAELTAAVFLVAFALQGLAFIHRVTRGLQARPLLLIALYLFIILLPPVLLLFSFIGLMVQGFRQPPPPPKT